MVGPEAAGTKSTPKRRKLQGGHHQHHGSMGAKYGGRWLRPQGRLGHGSEAKNYEATRRKLSP